MYRCGYACIDVYMDAHACRKQGTPLVSFLRRIHLIFLFSFTFNYGYECVRVPGMGVYVTVAPLEATSTSDPPGAGDTGVTVA